MRNIEPFKMCQENGAIPEFVGIEAQMLNDETLEFGKEYMISELRTPEIEVFEHWDFAGVSWRTSLSYRYVGDFWNDKISSIIVYSGIWRFFEHRDFKGDHWDLGPGHHRRTPRNDAISSWYLLRR